MPPFSDQDESEQPEDPDERPEIEGEQIGIEERSATFLFYMGGCRKSSGRGTTLRCCLASAGKVPVFLSLEG